MSHSSNYLLDYKLNPSMNTHNLVPPCSHNQCSHTISSYTLDQKWDGARFCILFYFVIQVKKTCSTTTKNGAKVFFFILMYWFSICKKVSFLARAFWKQIIQMLVVSINILALIEKLSLFCICGHI